MCENHRDEIFLSIVIPAYNEESRIANTLVKIRDYLDRQDYSSEIIVVSGDRGIRDLCQTLGALIMGPDNFLATVREAFLDVTEKYH